MKILWLASTPGLLKNTNHYNGGGWVAALQEEIIKVYGNKIEMSLAYLSDKNSHEEYEGTHYYGIAAIKHTFWHYTQKEKAFCDRIRNVISEVSPDIILCFGTENGLGLACSLTDIPVIIHLQGILNPYYEAWMPQGLSWTKWLCGNRYSILTWLALKKFKKREIKMFRSCKYFLGRTEWDKSICHLLAPQAKYFYCSEMLRPDIYNSQKIWNNPSNKTKRIVSIISNAIYKGGDVILRAAKILKNNTSFKFEWEVYGVDNMQKWEQISHVKHDEVNVKVFGVINAHQLIDILTTADVYVHPSYIENSPNTVCEAQLLGIPVIATNVGGTSSLIKNGETGLLVPANDPYLIASNVLMLTQDNQFSLAISSNARKNALDRHKSISIIDNLISVFTKVLELNDKNVKRK